MTIQHNVITDPDIHEPKGVAASASGKVYTANGAGSGSWVYPPAKGIAEMLITGGTTAHAVAAASAFTLINPSGEWAASGFEDVLSVTPASGYITLVEAGHYYIDFWMTFTTAALAAGTEYKFAYALDGVVSPRYISIEKHTAGVDNLSVSASFLANATANQQLSLYVAGDGTSSATNMTPIEAGITALSLQ